MLTSIILKQIDTSVTKSGRLFDSSARTLMRASSPQMTYVRSCIFVFAEYCIIENLGIFIYLLFMLQYLQNLLLKLPILTKLLQ